VPAGGRRHELRDTFGSLRADSLCIEATFLPEKNDRGQRQRLPDDRGTLALPHRPPPVGRCAYILQHGHYQIEVMANLDKVPRLAR
jgi:hypothetical protein